MFAYRSPLRVIKLTWCLDMCAKFATALTTANINEHIRSGYNRVACVTGDTGQSIKLSLF